MTKRLNHLSGFTMIETLVALAVLGIFFGAVSLILQQVIQNVAASRIRATALSLAQSKMEIINNLPYASVGTIGGIPSGTISPEEVITVNSLAFTIQTTITYIDDPYDGVAPQDSVSTDYKRVQVAVLWGGAYPSRTPLTLVSNIVPKSVETTVSGGTLYIHVFDANGQPIPEATVHIDNTVSVPEIHLQTLTDTSGKLTLPGSPACVTCYQISVTKTNYSTDRTYSTSEVANPLQPLATVIDGQISQLSFAIDRVSTLNVRSYGSRESGYPPIANVIFTLKGAKIIGYDTHDQPVYKYSYTTNTGGGIVSIPSLEWDVYTLDFTDSAHNLAGSNPLQPVALPPAANLTLDLVAVPKTNTNLLVAVIDPGQTPLASASVELKNTSLNYDVTKTTGSSGSADFGQAFFGGLSVNTYDLTLTLSGYEEATASLSISGINQQKYILNLSP